MGVIRMIYPGITTTLTVFRDCIDLGIIEINTEINEIKFEDTEMKSQEIILTISSNEIVNNQKFTVDNNAFFRNRVQY